MIHTIQELTGQTLTNSATPSRASASAMHRPAEARAATRTAVDAAVHDYSTDSEDPQSSLEHAQHWQRIKRLAASKGIAAFREAIRKLSSYQPLDEEARWLLQLADQLELLPRKAQARALFYRPRSKKARLYTAVIRSWTNASGFLGASEEGPLQRFVCRVVRNIGLRLSDAISRQYCDAEHGGFANQNDPRPMGRRVAGLWFD